jgi:HK97 family phage prohead protease
MTIIRAYSTFEFKAAAGGSGKRMFTGIASTISTDTDGDIVEPRGMEIKIPTPLLWQHKSGEPIGWVRAARVSDKGIEVDCEVAEINESDSPELKAEIDKRWTQLKTGLVRGLSIGFNALEAARIEGTYGYRYLKTKLLELSTVTIAANQDCSLTAIKSADVAMRRAALGAKSLPVVRLDPSPAASGTQSPGVPGTEQRRKGVVYLNQPRKD